MVKKMRNVATALAVGGVAIVAGSLVGYKIATDKELRDYLVRNLQDAFNISKRKVTGMTEDVAMRTARMSRNPKINPRLG